MKIIQLTQRKITLVDDQDFLRVSAFKWHASKQKNSWIAASNMLINGKRRPVPLHRFILNAPSRFDVDHKNGDSLDNRRNNLRICEHIKNTQAFHTKRKNTASKYRGVSWHKAGCFWTAQICPNWKKIHLGCFQSEIEAAKAYDAAAKQMFGSFASPNFP